MCVTAISCRVLDDFVPCVLSLQLTPLLASCQGSALTLPSGAMGVFNVASDWSLGQPHASPVCDMETWMVMELMDRGTLAAVVRGGGLVHPVTKNIKMVSVRGVDGGGGRWGKRGGGGGRWGGGMFVHPIIRNIKMVSVRGAGGSKGGTSSKRHLLFSCGGDGIPGKALTITANSSTWRNTN